MTRQPVNAVRCVGEPFSTLSCQVGPTWRARYSSDLRLVITPPLKRYQSGNEAVPRLSQNEEQFLLVPKLQSISVRSLETGRVVKELTTSKEFFQSSPHEFVVQLRSVCVCRLRRDSCVGEAGGSNESSVEHAVLAACSDGTLREWSLNEVVASIGQQSENLPPRRVFELADGDADMKITHLASHGDLIYALHQQKNSSKAHPLRKRKEGHLESQDDDDDEADDADDADDAVKRGKTMGVAGPSSHNKKRPTGGGDCPTAVVRIALPSHDPTLQTSSGSRMKLVSSGAVEDGHATLTTLVVLKQSHDHGSAAKRARHSNAKEAFQSSGHTGTEHWDHFGDNCTVGISGRPQRLLACYRRHQLREQGMDWLASFESDRKETNLDTANDGPGDAFALLVLPSGILLHCDRTNQGDGPEDRNNQLRTEGLSTVMLDRTKHVRGQTAVTAAISSASGDVAVGYSLGFIEVFLGLLDGMRKHLDKSKTGFNAADVTKDVTLRTFHWHSKPVSALCFWGGQGSLEGASPTVHLTSGGEESVLILWNLAQGHDRPMRTLARLAYGGITEAVTNPYKNEMECAVAFHDNSIKFISGGNHAIYWCIQGYANVPIPNQARMRRSISNAIHEPSARATASTSRLELAAKRTIMRLDPRTGLPVLANLSSAPGFVHWYDYLEGRVVGTLEVAPYNVSSRKGMHDFAIPAPSVSHMQISNGGRDIITVDEVPSENIGVGATRQLRWRGDWVSLAVATTIKFWSLPSQMPGRDSASMEMPYQLVAAMPSPHGLEAEVAELAVSAHGNVACTLSNEEGALRLWERTLMEHTNEGEERSQDIPLPKWKCRCRISYPSGFARSHADPLNCYQSVTFSPDESVLAVAFGRHLTLWNHESASLLTTVNMGDAICGVDFIRPGIDLVLMSGNRAVSVQPPFGEGCSPYFGEWSWLYGLEGCNQDRLEVSCAIPLHRCKGVAIAISDPSNRTTVAVVDDTTGKPKFCGDADSSSTVRWTFRGKVVAMLECPPAAQPNKDLPKILAVTNRHMMLELTYSDDSWGKTRTKVLFSKEGKTEESSGPVVPYLQNLAQSSRDDEESRTVFEKYPVRNERAVTATGALRSSDLPSLSGSFARAFIGQQLRKVSLQAVK